MKPTPIPFRVRPMLATLVPAPFDEPGWVYEEKYDGYRLIAYKEGDRVSLVSRNDIDRTSSFPNIAEAIFEGIVAKDDDSFYAEGRSKSGSRSKFTSKRSS